MRQSGWAVWLWLLVLNCAGFFLFPGHTILQSDTLIYIPILEHLQDPSLLRNDLIATRPHVSFTAYDEVALLLRRLTGASFEWILMLQQFVYRFCGLAGAYLLARSTGLSASLAILGGSLVTLGAAVLGPAVLTVEYEPVPRGFGLAFELFALGLLATGRSRAAALATGLAFLFHPNTALPFWGLLFLIALWKRQWGQGTLLLIAPVLLTVLMLAQGRGAESQPIFGTIPPMLEAIQRYRASYNWVSMWLDLWWLHYLIIWLVSIAAYWRVKDRLSLELRALALGLPFIGLLSVPLSYLLTELYKWVLMPQFQPGRYLVYTVLFAVLLAGIAGAWAIQKGRRLEAAGFLFFVFLVPTVPNLGYVRWERSTGQVLLVLAMAIAGTLLVSWRPFLAGAFAIVPFIVIPTVAGVQNYPPLHNDELDDLARWAKANTDRDAVFQFYNAGRALEPAVFRVRAVRALYVDWKGGGQVNFLPAFAEVWWVRWNQVQHAKSPAALAEFGVDYAVMSKSEFDETKPKCPVAFQNNRWVVLRLARQVP